jgi:peptide chain release factor 3
MRNTPVIVFVNKLDRPGNDPFELLDEIEKELKIKVRPLSWPISQGPTFKGVYNLFEQKLFLFSGDDKQTVSDDIIEIKDIHSPELDKYIKPYTQRFLEEIELVNEVYPEFDIKHIPFRRGAPVFFGSALNNFGVKELLDCFVQIAPYPRPTVTDVRTISPFEDK